MQTELEDNFNSEIKIYQSVSSAGAGILGLGLGMLLSSWLAGWAPVFLFVGIVFHSLGMYKLHYGGQSAWKKLPKWLQLSISVCWVILAGLLAWLLWYLLR